MTLIAALKDPEGISVLSDSFGKGNWKYPCTNKIFEYGEFTLGFTGDLVDQELLIQSDPPHFDDLPINILASRFGQHIRRTLETFRRTDEDNETHTPKWHSAAIVIARGRMFVLDNDFGMAEYHEYVAIGAGEEFALGSLYTSKSRIQDTERRLLIAADAASVFSEQVNAPYTIVRVEAPTEPSVSYAYVNNGKLVGKLTNGEIIPLTSP